ncbi:MAG TPA: hypothetical protein VGL49_07755, partial [Acidimicrobiales bacterium]
MTALRARRAGAGEAGDLVVGTGLARRDAAARLVTAPEAGGAGLAAVPPRLTVRVATPTGARRPGATGRRGPASS